MANGASTHRGHSRAGGNPIFLLCFLLFFSFSAHADTFSDHVQRLDTPLKMPPLVFEDGAGAQHALNDYRGRFVLLNVWATWCGPCVREMPSLDALQKNFGGALAVIPLSEDRGDATVGTFYARHNITHLPIAVDHAGIAPSALHLQGLPITLLIDPQGFEVARIEGDRDWDSPDAAAFLKGWITDRPHP